MQSDDVRKFCKTHLKKITDTIFEIEGSTAFAKHSQHYFPNPIGPALGIAVNFSFSSNLGKSASTYCFPTVLQMHSSDFFPLISPMIKTVDCHCQSTDGLSSSSFFYTKPTADITSFAYSAVCPPIHLANR